MDVFAHTLWTNAVFHLKYHQQRRMRYWAAFFGVAPDLIGFAPLIVYLILSGRIVSGFSAFNDTSHWTYAFAAESYNYTHSLVVFAFCFIVVSLIGNIYYRSKNSKFHRFWFYWPMLGWLLHILIDIPSHANDFYLTPFLYPISHYQFTHGVSWANPIYMAVNYCSLIAVYIGMFIYQRWKYDK